MVCFRSRIGRCCIIILLLGAGSFVLRSLFLVIILLFLVWILRFGGFTISGLLYFH